MAPRHNFTAPTPKPHTPPSASPREQFFGRYREPEELSSSQEVAEVDRQSDSRDMSDQSLASWKVLEAAPPEPGRRFLFVTGGLLIAIIGYALFSDSPIMAITFILIGLMGYLLLYREPRLLSCHITNDGVIVNRELFPFETAKSFWVFENEKSLPYISLETGTFISPHVHVPLDGIDSEEIRDILARFLPEEKPEPALVDILSQMLHI